MKYIHIIKKTFPQLSLSQFSFLLALWLALALNIAFFKQIKTLTPYVGIKSILFVLSAVVVVAAAYNILMQLLQWRYSAKIVAVIFIFLGGVSAYGVSSLGVVITTDQIQNMMQTDTKEVLDLVSWQFGLWFVLMVILPMMMILKIPLKSQNFLQNLKAKLGHIVLSMVLILGSLFVFYVDYAAIFREHRDLKGMISPQNVIASSFSYYKKRAPQKNLPLVLYGEDAHQTQTVDQGHLPKLMVLVVGETARAESFAFNGYAKNTNPELSKQNIINFSQVSSCGTATAVSLPCMFSGMTKEQYDEQLASHREGLLDLAQRAGYKVTWIDNNSGCKKVCDRVEQYQIPKEIQAKWCDTDGECKDEILVEALQYYVALIPQHDQQPRLIVLHQMGSHGPAYYKRTTAKYQPFQPHCETNAIQGCTSQELINSYDNSIVYTDHVLSEVINTLKPIERYQTAFWYVSDHGESTGEHGLYLHGAPYAIAPSQQTHIPMILWFSSAWQQHDKAQVDCLTQQQQKVLSHDHLFPTVLSLLHIQSQAIDQQNNMLQGCANAPTRI